MLEFTGERVIPGEVDADLWNEHLSRYLFAARLAHSKRVTDIGCGTGYGAAELALTAAQVIGFDVSSEAVDWARERFSSPNLRFEAADCGELPLTDGSIDLAVSFEVIEHLESPERLLREAQRILAPGGQFVVSTPNADYYTETRATAGPNPFHHREYTLTEFRELLGNYFPHVTIFQQNHTPAIVFHASSGKNSAPAASIASSPAAETAHFFVAVCAMTPQIGAPTFLYVPSSGNVLRERERHIARLDSELKQKQVWLDQSLAEHTALVETHRHQKEELEAANDWARKRDAELAEKESHVAILEKDAESYKVAIAELDAELARTGAELETRTAWAVAAQAELDRKVAELAAAVELLTKAEGDLAERTRWAISLEAAQRALLDELRQSRWMRLGRKLNVGPTLPS